MKRSTLIVIAFFLLLFANISTAVRVSAIYKAEIPVTTQTEHERNKVLPEALVQVLVKVNGNSQIVNNPDLRAHLNQASTLMQEFSYASSNIPTYPYLLTVEFDPESINTLLRNAGVPIWGMNRPLLLAWVDYEVPNKPAEMIGSGSENNIQKMLKHQADLRGLPLILPMLDMTDINLVTANDITTMAIPNLSNAAKRYSSDGMLIIRVIRLTDGFLAQTRLLLGDQQWGWKTTGNSLQSVLSSLINNVTDTLAGRYATVIKSTVQEQLTLKITGVSQPDDFSQLMHYVQHLTPVANVQVEKIMGAEVILKINLRGTVASFTQALLIGKKLTAVPVESNGNLFVYQWNH
jgi:hypothetical protein